MEPALVPLELPDDVRAAPTATAELVDRRAGYSETFANHHQRLLRLAFLLTGDRDQAEEAVAETFARVWPHWRRGRVADEKAYLTRTLVNEVNSLGRRAARSIRTSAAHAESPDPAPASDDVTPERLRVIVALNGLPKRQRAVIVLRFYDDLSEAATAAALGMRVGTVKSQTFRGLARLKTLLLEEDQ